MYVVCVRVKCSSVCMNMRSSMPLKTYVCPYVFVCISNGCVSAYICMCMSVCVSACMYVCGVLVHYLPEDVSDDVDHTPVLPG